MKRQNRTLVFVFVFVLGVMVVVLSKMGVIKPEAAPGDQQPAIELKDESPQEAMGEKIDETLSLKGLAQESGDKSHRPEQLIEEQKIFSAILSDLNKCFDLHASSLSEAPPITIESVYSLVQNDLGPSLSQADRSMNWHLKNREGLERRLRLEISEGESGTMVRELKYYAVDKEGLPIPMELAAEKKMNPTDETINLMLKEGDVFYKEKAAYATFSGGARVEFVEKNGTLAEIEFQKGSRFFRCQNLKSKETCQCVR